MPNILIGTPMYGGMCTGEYTRSMLSVMPTLSAVGIGVSFAFIYNDSLITSARNKLATMFVEHDFSHMLFVDADIGFDAQDILKMLEADKDVIAGVYPKKRINWDRVDMAVKAGIPTEELQFHTGDLVVNLVDHERERKVRIADPVEIWGAGTGFMLIKREVMEALKSVVDSYQDDDGHTLYEYFFLKKDKKLNKQLTEDYAFCALCREHGIKIYAAPWAKLTHTGSYTFTGTLIPTRS
jgi:hypothetical protein